MSRKLDHPRYWRPVILAFESDRERRERLLRFAGWLEGRSGLTTAVLILQGEGAQARRLRDAAEKELHGEVVAEPTAFPRVVVAPDVEDALPVLLQSYGLGPVRANTVLLDWEGLNLVEKTGAAGGDVSRLRLALRYGCNLVLLAAGPGDLERVEEAKAHDRRIDVWHRDNATGRLMLLLAYLMTRTETWKDASIRVVGLAGPGSRSRNDARRDRASVAGGEDPGRGDRGGYLRRGHARAPIGRRLDDLPPAQDLRRGRLARRGRDADRRARLGVPRRRTGARRAGHLAGSGAGGGRAR